MKTNAVSLISQYENRSPAASGPWWHGVPVGTRVLMPSHATDAAGRPHPRRGETGTVVGYYGHDDDATAQYCEGLEIAWDSDGRKMDIGAGRCSQLHVVTQDA